MKDATPRTKALLAGAATVLVFGIVVPANATADRPTGRTDTGFVGKAYLKADPKGQEEGDHNRGFTCDQNQGAGQEGHPALPHDCEGTTETGTETGTDPGTDPGTDYSPGT